MKYIERTFETCETTCVNKKCQSELQCDTTDFRTINKELKSYGWITKNIDGQWLDFCCEKCFRQWKLDNK